MANCSPLVKMRYFGSKSSTLGNLLTLVRLNARGGTLCDPFGGIGTVGSHFKAAGYKVFTGDQLRFAKCFQVARIEYSGLPLFTTVKSAFGFRTSREIFAYLDGLPPVSGWFSREFSETRYFFSEENAGRIDAIRRCTKRWEIDGLLSEKERDFLIASLINCADRVANTAGTYYAYLKHWHRKAKQTFSYSPLMPTRGIAGTTFLGDALKLVQMRRYDVLYLDPPYNERRYAGYYHLPELIASGRQWKKVYGVSGVTPSAIRSAFNNRSTAADALREIVKSMRCSVLVFHYSDDGLITPNQARKILASAGTLSSFQLRSAGYTTKLAPREIMHRVYLVKT